MRKRLAPTDPPHSTSREPDWIGLESAAEVEVTSEDAAYPIEAALGSSPAQGWRASTPGPQTIRLLFDHPLSIGRIHLEFREEQCERSQEYLLQWRTNTADGWRQIVRQQFNFHPGATCQIEDYKVELDGATALEIQITPDRTHRQAHASLHRLQIA